MWPFSETNAAAMRTLKTPVYAESSAQSGEEHLPAWKRETKDQHGVSTSSRLARIHASLTISACLKIGKHSRPELQMRREACGIWPSCGEKFGAAPRPATRASHSISRSSVGTAGNRGNERLSSAIVRRPLCRAHLHTSDGVILMRRLSLALGLLAACAATGASAETVNLTGTYRCIQMCRNGMLGAPTFVTQNGQAVNLTTETGEAYQAWPDWSAPYSRIWIDARGEGAVYSPDGMRIQFDDGRVWQRDIGPPSPVVFRRAPVVYSR